MRSSNNNTAMNDNVVSLFELMQPASSGYVYNNGSINGAQFRLNRVGDWADLPKSSSIQINEQFTILEVKNSSAGNNFSSVGAIAYNV